jgi:hypothetical protein
VCTGEAYRRKGERNRRREIEREREREKRKERELFRDLSGTGR